MRIGSSAQGAINLIDGFKRPPNSGGDVQLGVGNNDVGALVQETVEDFRTISATRGIAIEAPAPETPIQALVE